MEYVAGQDLARSSASKGRLPVEKGRQLPAQAARGLD
jgi:hypothetical protein